MWGRAQRHAEAPLTLAARRFFGTFRDRQHVYLLLEFCQGGELWTKLREVYGAGGHGLGVGRDVPCSAVLCRAVLRYAVLARVVPCGAVPCHAMP